MSEISKNNEELPLSQLTLEGSAFNIDDLKILKALNDRQDDVTLKFIQDTYDEHAIIICKTVGDMLRERNKEIFDSLKDIRNSIRDLKLTIKGINIDMKSIHADLKLIHADLKEINGRLDDHDRRLKILEEK